jgi:DNA-directed RNA polymerase subunit RPC12/RpoP
MAIKCPECGHVGGNAASEEMEAFGGAVCEECGFTDLDEGFEHVEDGEG